MKLFINIPYNVNVKYIVYSQLIAKVISQIAFDEKTIFFNNP